MYDFERLIKEELSYRDCLTEFKKSVRGDNALGHMELAVLRQLPKSSVRWLDVGVGDGVYCRHLSDRLRAHGVKLEITAIEKDRASAYVAATHLPSANITQENFEQHLFQDSFDVICFSHSLYYFPDLKKTILKAVDLLDHGGLFLSVCWSLNDDLYKLHSLIFDESGQSTMATAESVESELYHHGSLKRLHSVQSEGAVDFSLWHNRESFFKNISVIARGRHLADAKAFEVALRKFQQSELAGYRLNIVSSAVKII